MILPLREAKPWNRSDISMQYQGLTAIDQRYQNDVLTGKSLIDSSER